jgi:hypothetical protein
VSLKEIAGLLADADQTDIDARLLDGDAAAGLKSRARDLRRRANELADKTKPGIIHPLYGYGVILGTRNSMLLVSFGGKPLALPADKVEAAP